MQLVRWLRDAAGFFPVDKLAFEDAGFIQGDSEGFEGGFDVSLLVACGGVLDPCGKVDMVHAVTLAAGGGAGF